MTRRKAEQPNDGKTQRQRFIESARELGTDESEDAFRRIMRKVATAPIGKPKKASRKRKA